MKKVIFFLIISCVSLGAQTFATFEEAAEAQKKYTSISLKNFKFLSSDEDTIRFTGVFFGQVASGEKYAWLEDELVVVNKTTRKAKRIYSCGNIGKFWAKKENKKEQYIPLSMLASLQIPGPKGDKGAPGYTPQKGIDYSDGAQGEKGDDGSSTIGWIALGTTIVGGIVVTIILINNKNNPAVTPPAGTPPGGQTGPAFRFSFSL